MRTRWKRNCCNKHYNCHQQMQIESQQRKELVCESMSRYFFNLKDKKLIISNKKKIKHKIGYPAKTGAKLKLLPDK